METPAITGCNASLGMRVAKPVWRDQISLVRTGADELLTPVADPAEESVLDGAGNNGRPQTLNQSRILGDERLSVVATAKTAVMLKSHEKQVKIVQRVFMNRCIDFTNGDGILQPCSQLVIPKDGAFGGREQVEVCEMLIPREIAVECLPPC